MRWNGKLWDIVFVQALTEDEAILRIHQRPPRARPRVVRKALEGP